MDLCGVIEGFYGRPWTMEQRLELFSWMQGWGMNTYMYGPKDDLKMRAAWRERYSDLEMSELLSLAEHCQQKEIAFVYTIAPGLDICYADEADLQALKSKIDQLLSKGVKHFCILFDDIPFRMRDADAKRFASFAGAQAYVTNELFYHIRKQTKGLFLFCPTEYCGRMATPSVKDSSYLQELGETLEKEIDVFWTGPEIVSEEISVASVLELQSVLKRKPLIWDNIHANDYDIRRIYLGPFSGKTSALKNEVRGILSNPNNEFEANFIPLKTLAAYASADIYDAHIAYQAALKAWLPRFKTHGKEAIKLEEVELLGDLFYLFFEHGEQVKSLLAEAQEMLNSEPHVWGDRVARLEQTSQVVGKLFHKLTELENRDLLYSLYSYVWEVEHEIRYLVNYLKWLKEAKPGEEFGRPVQLANTFRGGVAATIERFLPLDERGKVSL
ncbi:MAG: beta-N-acetylglucosaminidase domain-containing protein [Trueperaceae bacterium]|nr:beta-N-acetylglucosaminidase domain-containing protein [Trueperaceae bacterium]